MNEQLIEQPSGPMEMRLAIIARGFPYPATPDIASSVKQQLAAPSSQPVPQPRRLAWTVTIAALAVIVLLTLPPVRTTVVEVLRRGVVRIFLLEPLATSTPLLTTTPAASAEATISVSPQSFQSTPHPSATPISVAPDSARETTTALAETQAQVNLPVHLPARPLDSKLSDQALRLNVNLHSKKSDFD
jgi:hypothetical protein